MALPSAAFPSFLLPPPLKRLLERSRRVAVIRRSEFFHPAWVRREGCPEGADPARFYLDRGTDGSIDPGPDFDGAAYLAANSDVRLAGMNPLVHYEWYGRRAGRPLRPAPAANAPERDEGQVFEGDVAPPRHRRTAVLASFPPDGRIPDSLVYLAEGLRAVADNIVFVASCPVREGEFERIRPFVCHADCSRHGAYDFGSYKRGVAWARGRGLLDPGTADELVLCNDSCFGPVFPFAEAFGTMASRPPCDFWGMTQYEWCGRRHIQSYFLVFRRRVLDAPALESFLGSVLGPLDRGDAVERYETRLTRFLEDAGFVPATLVPPAGPGRIAFSPIRRPASLASRHRMPLAKKKAFLGDTDEPVGRLEAILARENPALFGIASREIAATKADRTRAGAPAADRPGGDGAPSISVFVPVYNGAATLARALDSVLAQTLAPCEILVLDDGSADGSAAVAEGYADRGVRLVRLPHQGVYAVRNEALRLVRGDWFLNLDADNWIEPDLLARAAARIPDLPPSVAVLYPDMLRFGGADRFESWPDYSPERLRESNFLDMNSVIRTSAAREVGFDPSFATGLGDYDFFLSLAERGHAAEALRGCPLHYMVHDDSISGANRRLGRRHAIARRLVAKHRAFFSAREARRLLRHYALLDSRALQAAAVRDLEAGRRAAASAKLLRALRLAPGELGAMSRAFRYRLFRRR